MEEADQLSDRVGIIDCGKIIALDTPTNLKRAIDQHDIIHAEIEQFDPAQAEALRRLPMVEHVICRFGERERVWSLALHTAASRAALPALIDLIGSGSGRIRHLEIAQPTLEDVFISLTGKQLRE
jgi:ABC-2 type transport system ATP-binding protein